MKNIIVVDLEDNEVGLKTYAELAYGDIYRVTALWLTDLENKHCLVTQRKWTKHNDPGKWMMAVSGTVEEGETYESNIVKETEEEIGLTGLAPKKSEKIFVDDGSHKFFVQFFTADISMGNASVKIQEDEVESYQWINIDNLINWVNEKPEDFVPTMKDSLVAVGVIND